MKSRKRENEYKPLLCWCVSFRFFSFVSLRTFFFIIVDILLRRQSYIFVFSVFHNGLIQVFPSKKFFIAIAAHHSTLRVGYNLLNLSLIIDHLSCFYLFTIKK